MQSLLVVMFLKKYCRVIDNRLDSDIFSAAQLVSKHLFRHKRCHVNLVGLRWWMLFRIFVSMNPALLEAADESENYVLSG